MAKLTTEEKAANDWWMSRFDGKHYKTITLYQHRTVVQTYTTANADYSDFEDARDALMVARRFGIAVTSVSVDGIRFKQIKGITRRIANNS
ncbi:hypothetical protein [Levilactobacillus brevis]|uniref:hypothetical protein n=1 Tax=Levilactobacillus brevis TaxID=1580 RepID=UPI000B3541E5|nr:hypothetical protein [Levilactobacillus brevis]